MKQFTITLVFFFSILNVEAQSPSWVWANEIESTFGFSSPMQNCTSDASDNLYITGSLGNPTVFDTVSISGLLENMFIAKYNAGGGFDWVRTVAVDTGAHPRSEGFSVKTDATGNVYVAGNFTGKIIIGTDTLISAGLLDVFLAKYNAHGDVVWAKKAGGIFNDQLTGDGMCIQDDKIFITGKYGLFNFSPAIPTADFDTITLTSRGNSDNFIAAFDTAGHIKWAKTIGGLNDENNNLNPNTVSSDANHNIYIGGSFKDSLFFGALQIATGGGFYIVKCDNGGNFSWVQPITGDVYVGPYMSADPAGNTYATIIPFTGQINFGDTILSVNGMDEILVKYDAGGSLIYIKDLGTPDIVLPLAGASGVYLTGQFQNKYVVGNDTLTSLGMADFFISKLDGNGNMVWAIGAGGLQNDFSYNLALSSSGALSICGIHHDSITLGNTLLPGDGIFVARLAQLTRISDVTKTHEISLYPNPNTGNFTIDLQGEKYQTLTITDISGKQVHHQTLSPQSSVLSPQSSTLNLNLSLTSGMYFIRLTGKQKSAAQKFIINK